MNAQDSNAQDNNDEQRRIILAQNSIDGRDNREVIMHCAWCSPSGNGTDGICDTCMLVHFHVDPASIRRAMKEHAKTSTSSTGM